MKNTEVTRTGIALFDFDGTVSDKSSMFLFARMLSNSNTSYLLKMLCTAPSYLFSILGLKSNDYNKEVFLKYFFKGRSLREVRSVADSSVFQSKLNKTVYDEALRRIEWHKQQGHEVVVVSASCEVWLIKWCRDHGVKLIASKMAGDFYYTGKLEGLNCNYEEKVNRIRKEYDLVKFDKVYAYGNSKGDHAMLDVSDVGVMNPFNKDREPWGNK